MIINLHPKTFHISCKAGPNLRVSIRNNLVVLAKYDVNDMTQYWLKHEYTQTGASVFALENWSTKQVIVQNGGEMFILTPWDESTTSDTSTMWTFRSDEVEGFHVLTTLNSGGSSALDCTWAVYTKYVVNEKSMLSLYEAHGNDNQRWMLVEARPPLAPVNKGYFPIICKANKSLCLSISGDDVVLAKPNVNDLTQYWIKYEYPNVKDLAGVPAFALVNKSTNQVILQNGYEKFKLIPWNETMVESLTMWTYADDEVIGFRVLNTLNNGGNSAFNATISRDDENSILSIYGTTGDDNQRWMLVGDGTVRIYCRNNVNLNIAIRDGKLVLANADPNDPCQQWIKDYSNSEKITDEEGHPSFALANKATNQAIKATKEVINKNGYQLGLVPYDKEKLDVALLWTEATETQADFHQIRMISNLNMCFNGVDGNVRDGTAVALWPAEPSANSNWKIDPFNETLYECLACLS